MHPFTRLVLAATLAATNASAATTAQAGVPATSSAPTTAPASNDGVLTRPGTDRIRVQLADRTTPTTWWVHRPVGYAPGQRPPLIVCLHGTDDTAEQMIAFWQARHMRIPAVLIAPQGVGKGWCSDDVPAIRAMFDWLPSHVWYDPHRVLLAGFSAGGAMTFQLVYKEKVPVTAAVALANYVPPRLTPEEVRERRRLPVFYAVGMTDVNHELMRAGLEFLRDAGASVELYHPPIGHVLNPDVAQAAMDWFGEQCMRQTAAAIDQASQATELGLSAARLEQIASQPAWNDAEQVARARQVLGTITAPGEEALRQAEQLIEQKRWAPAVQALREIERDYGISQLGTSAHRRREQLEADPLVRAEVQIADTREREQKALSEYADAQKLVAQRRLSDAADACRRVISLYPDTPAAERSRRLLKLLEGRSSP